MNTLVLTDIATIWTEFLPLLCKSAAGVVHGIDIVNDLLPFLILGVDTDNGSEFINYALLDFCKENKITFTRSRPYKKNDQAHVEERNGSIVRRVIGYDRYEGEKAWHALVNLYAVLRLYVNYFQPSLKLISKKRDGSKTTKKYDKAKTPFQRVLESKHISDEVKQKMRTEYEELDPVDLLKRLRGLQEKFWQCASNNATQQDDKIAAQVEPNKDAAESEKVAIDGGTDILTVANMPNRKHRRTKKPRKKMSPRTWITRKDPFEEVWDGLRQQLELNPHTTAKNLMDGLVSSHPDEFNRNQLRTLQRRVASWRLEQTKLAKAEHLQQASNEDNATKQYLSLLMNTEKG